MTLEEAMGDLKDWPLGDVVDMRQVLKDRVFDRQQEIKAYTAAVSLFEEFLANAMEQGRLKNLRGECSSVTYSEEDVPTIYDWERFEEYLLQNEATHLVRRQVNTKAWRTTVELEGRPIPGIRAYTKRGVTSKRLKPRG